MQKHEQSSDLGADQGTENVQTSTASASITKDPVLSKDEKTDEGSEEQKDDRAAQV